MIQNLITHAELGAWSSRGPRCRNGIQLILNARVVSAEEHTLTLDCKATGKSTIPFSACVWAMGVAINPLAKRVQDKLPAQSNFRCPPPPPGVCA